MTAQSSTDMMPSDQWSLISDHSPKDCELPPYRRKNSSPAYDNEVIFGSGRRITFAEPMLHVTRNPPAYNETPETRQRPSIRSSVRPYWEERRRSSNRSDNTSDTTDSSRSPSPRRSEAQPTPRARTTQNWNLGLYQGAPFVGGGKSIWEDVLLESTWTFRWPKASRSAKKKVGSIRKLIPWDHPVYDMPADQQARLRSRGIDPVLAAEMKAAGMPTPF